MDQRLLEWCHNKYVGEKKEKAAEDGLNMPEQRKTIRPQQLCLS